MIKRHDDPRFYNLLEEGQSDFYSLLDFKKDNNVIDALQKKLASVEEVDYEMVKEDIMAGMGLKFFARNVIPIDSKCQIAGQNVSKS